MLDRERHFLILAALIFFAFMAVAGTLGNQRPLRILISNDDGIDAPGLAALCDQLARIATVTIAAPSQNTSGTSHSMTFLDPIMVTETEKGGVKRYSIEATPATCVRLALESLLEAKPDLVVTGINRGSNLGMVTFYSATVGAAREAATKGIPAVAVSLQRGPIMDYAAAAAFVVELVSELNRRPLDPGLLLNVNIPSLPKDQIKGTLVVPQDLRPALQFYERRVNPRGQVYFWNTYQELDAGPDKTDVWAVRNGYIAVTPFRVDQTDPAKMNKLGRLRGAGRKY